MKVECDCRFTKKLLAGQEVRLKPGIPGKLEICALCGSYSARISRRGFKRGAIGRIRLNQYQVEPTSEDYQKRKAMLESYGWEEICVERGWAPSYESPYRWYLGWWHHLLTARDFKYVQTIEEAQRLDDEYRQAMFEKNFFQSRNTL
ncbi:MAG: hypothetical protein HY764_04370 [Candidatus Portnoybacteria bacterium]|nr:hypothetical protein [Candidatus Portnoybacteria bacterium]